MASVNAFGQMYSQFLGELSDAFPDNQTIKAAKERGFKSTTIDRFMKYTSPRTNQMNTRSAAFFSKKNKFADEIGLCEIWDSPDMTEQTRNAIWSYYGNLYMLAMTMSMLPPQMLSMIESTAEECAKNIQDKGEITQENLMSSMNDMLGKLMAQNKSR
jgi:hypothetical protein